MYKSNNRFSKIWFSHTECSPVDRRCQWHPPVGTTGTWGGRAWLVITIYMSWDISMCMQYSQCLLGRNVSMVSLAMDFPSMPHKHYCKMIYLIWPDCLQLITNFTQDRNIFDVVSIIIKFVKKHSAKICFVYVCEIPQSKPV